MLAIKRMLILGSALSVLLAWAPVQATTVLQMGFSDLAERAGKVFRGTVIAVEPGTKQVGGAELPTVSYRFRVEEAFKGQFETKGDTSYVEVTMVGNIKESNASSEIRHLSPLPELPTLTRGGEYVLFTTPPSSAGLSTTVGLAQGAFKIFLSDQGDEMVANGLDNHGLFNGPVSYSRLADVIRAEIDGQGGAQ